MSVKHSFPVFVFLVAVIAAYAAVMYLKQPESVNLANPPLNEAIADITFYDMEGQPAKLSDFKGDAILVNVWATWCPPCVAELPSLDILQAKYKSKGFKVVAVSVDRGVSEADIKKFLAARDIEYITPYQDKDREVPMKWKYQAVPTSFLIGRDGLVMRKYEGGMDWMTPAVLAEVEAAISAR